MPDPSSSPQTHGLDEDLQDLAAYAAEALGTPIALVTEIGEDRQTFLANQGFGRGWTSLEESFCVHAVLEKGVFEVSDAAADPRFRDNPLVTGDTRVRFYAGVPVPTGDGTPKNALCVLGTEARELTPFERRTLEVLARQVGARLALRRRETELEAERARAVEANEMLRRVTDRLALRVAYVDREFRYQFLNGEYARVYGCPVEGAIGRPIAELSGEAAFDAARPLLERALAGESITETLEVEYPFGRMWVDVSFEPDVREDGEVRGVVLHAADVSKRVEADRTLADERARLDRTLEVAGVATYELNVPRGSAWGNELFAEFFGVPSAPQGAPIVTYLDSMHPDDRPRVEAAIGRSLATGEFYEAEYRVRGMGGRERTVLARGDSTLTEEGNPLRLTGVILDITERAQAEAALAEEQARVERTLEKAEVGTFEWEIATDRVWSNSLVAEFFGHSEADARGGPVGAYFARIHEDDRAALQAAVEGTMASGEPYETEYRVSDAEGRERRVLTRGDATLDENGTPVRVSGVVLDVTERLRAEEEARHREELFRTVFEQAPDDAIVIMDARRAITAWNPAAERITGWSAKEAIGQTAGLIFTPEDRTQGAVMDELFGAVLDGSVPDERWHLRKDGSLFWGSGTMNALHDPDGSVRGYLKVFRDATERHQAARSAEALNEELELRVEERTQDLERAVREAEGFNYAISHDLRTPLRAIHMTSAILMEEAGPELSFGHRELLERQGRAASRLAQLIDGLLGLSRLSRVELKLQTIDMTREALSVVDLGSPCRVEVQESMEAQGDPGLIHSVWQNLIGNACKFSPNGGPVTVGEEDGVFFVRDEGVGFDMRYAPKIFLPFERLVADDAFPGTGIGLANVRRIVERHGGRVWAESELGKGSTFRFTLG